jgi:hypothetical protein
MNESINKYYEIEKALSVNKNYIRKNVNLNLQEMFKEITNKINELIDKKIRNKYLLENLKNFLNSFIYNPLFLTFPIGVIFLFLNLILLLLFSSF